MADNNQEQAAKEQAAAKNINAAAKAVSNAAPDTPAGKIAGAAAKLDDLSGNKISGALAKAPGADALSNPNLAKGLNAASKLNSANKSDGAPNPNLGQNKNGDLVNKNQTGSKDNKEPNSDNKDAAGSGNTNFDEKDSKDSKKNNEKSDEKESKEKSSAVGVPVTGEEGTEDQEDSALYGETGTQKIFKLVVFAIIIPTLFLVVVAVLIFSLLFSLGDTISEFFTNVGDKISSFFTSDQIELQEAFYNELGKVEGDIKINEGVCIDINLIAATLTVNIDPEEVIDSGNKSVFFRGKVRTYDELPTTNLTVGDIYTILYPDIEHGIEAGDSVAWSGSSWEKVDNNTSNSETETSDDGGTVVYDKKMKKEIALLANMQLTHNYYSLDKDLYARTGAYCVAGGGRGVVTAENKDSFDRDFVEWIKNTSRDIDSSSFEKIAANDVTSNFGKFFTKKVNEEKNYAYYYYYPDFKSDGTCSYDYAKDMLKVMNSSQKTELSIGNLESMTQSVYYWNLVNSFIPDYYNDYLPVSEPERTQKIHEIADDIYSLYQSMGPSTTCKMDSTYSMNSQYNYACVREDGSSNNTKVKLLQCADGTRYDPIEGEELVDLEKYITGVVYAENGGSSNYEALKAQAVAARTYLMANNDGKEIENGVSVLKIRNCTERQVYCDPNKGCNSDSSTAGKTVHSGTDGTKAYTKVPLPESSMVWTAVNETLGEIMYDSEGKVVTTGYNSSSQNLWNDDKSSDYLTLLSRTHSTMASVSSECIGASGEWSSWKQNAEPWGGKVIDPSSSTPEKKGKTIANIGCLMTSVAIQIARSGVPTTVDGEFNPGSFMEAHRANGGFVSCGTGGPRNCFMWNVSKVAPNFVYMGSVRSSKDTLASDLQPYLQSNNYIIINIHHPGEHHIALDRVDGDNIYIFDPGSSAVEIHEIKNLVVDSFSYYTVG